jgi:tRNA U34 5-carboxymethylaminomethyl modifying enzyme MnmG/GidA
LIFQALTKSKQKPQIINNTMPMKYQKKCFRKLKGLHSCKSSKTVFAISAGAAPDHVLTAWLKFAILRLVG